MNKNFEELLLTGVQKPARYVGNELNAVHKEWDKTPYRIALAYPDLYEIGMSNLGIQILYFIINQQPDVLAERVFAPWPDLEQQLVTHNQLLPSLESFTPLKEFDMVGFSLGHELTYTNIITMLKLGGIPLHSTERGEKDPLILAGGPCTFNPEPIAPFFDFFVIGEAEEILLEILTVLRQTKASARAEKLAALAKIAGVYVPQLGNKTVKRVVKDISNTPYPTKPIVPYIEAVHDRAVLEIMRGCKWGCRFCQAGWTGRPVREKKPEVLAAQGEEILKNTGYDELSLISLSSSDYSQIAPLAKTLAQKYERDKINIALPSMRTNSFSVKLAKEVSRVRPSGITLAPEAGTQRLRDAIGKNMTEENILESVHAAFSEGIEAIKLYFMIGLPTEIDEDLLGLCQLAQKIFDIGKSYTKRVRVTVNLATFVPRPHTPFQWAGQITIAETLAKQRLIKNNIRNKHIDIRWHQAEASYLEGVFARGDKQLTKVIEKAWELGARFDAWSECFKLDIWEKAFQECQINPLDYLKARELGQPLPWDNIDTGVPKELLISVARQA